MTSARRTSHRDDRVVATSVGVLYVLATAAGVAAVAMAAPADIAAMAASKGAVLATALLDVVMAVAVTGVAVMLYPVLIADARTRAHQGLALWYVATRITEGALFFVGVMLLAGMLTLSEAAAPGMAGGIPIPAALAHVLAAVHEYAWVAGQTVFCVGAAMLYVLLYLSRRVPRWISVWGLIAAPSMLIAGFLLPFTNDPTAPVALILYAPMGLQEMVLAGWLIVRGFATPSPGVPGVPA
jgi:hypothetical protein